MEIFSEDVIKMLFALALGSLVGAEREYWTKSAGFRTLILVCMGSALFTIISIHMGGPSNPDRIAANIITGIGFLGGGAIFRAESRVSGLTTATTIWMAAALGMGAGSGEYLLSAIGAIVVIIVLLGFRWLERVIDNIHQSREYRIVWHYKPENLYRYEELFKSCNLKALRKKQYREGSIISGTWEVRGSKENLEMLNRMLLVDEEIRSLDF